MLGGVSQDMAGERAVAKPAGTGGPAEPEQWAFICYSSSCRYQGAEAVGQSLARALAERPDGSTGTVVRAGCLGLCGAGPAVVTYPAGEVHLRVEPRDATELAAQLVQGRGLARRTVKVPPWYQQHIVARLESFVELLKRRMRERTA